MERGSVASRIVPSIGDALFLTVFIWALYKGAGLLNDGDTGWHIVTGGLILGGGSIPRSDPFSYTMPGIPWTAHEWLSEVIFAKVHSLAGLNGVVVLSVSVIALTFFFLYRYMTRSATAPLAAALLTAVAAGAAALHWLARPHVFSLPMTLAFYAILDSHQRGGKNRLMLLPLLMALWVNLHAGYILGLMLVSAYLAGNALLYYIYPAQRDEYKGKLKGLGLAALLTVAATSLNPHGPAILYFPFHLVGRTYIMDNVLEWLSPNFHDNRSFELMLLLYASVFALSRKRPDIFEGMLALMLAHMSLYSARYIPLMALVVTPMAAARAGGILGPAAEAAPEGVLKRVAARLKKVSDDVAGVEALLLPGAWPAAAVAASLAICLTGGTAFGHKVFDYRHDPKKFPVAALDFALKNGINGRMFNNDGWGGYIIYKSYPRSKVFFDGRSDMYGVEFLREYIEVARAGPGLEKVLDKYGVEWVLYNSGAPLTRLLAADGRWRLVYSDGTADILLRDTPGNRPLIEKYRNARFVKPDAPA